MKLLLFVMVLGSCVSIFLVSAISEYTNDIHAINLPESNVSDTSKIQPASNTSVTLDLNKMRYGIGEIVHVFGKASSNSTHPWSGNVNIELLHNKTVIYKTSVFPVNGTYKAVLLNTIKPGNYIVNASLDNTSESSWTPFDIVDYFWGPSFYSIIGGFVCITILMVIHAIGIRNIRLIELTNFLLFSGIVLSILLAVLFADVALGPNSPVGLVLKHPVDEQGNIRLDTAGLPQSGGQWIITVGGNQHNNYEDGIEIPVYVVVFGVIGGYLRYLYARATNRGKEALKEFRRIDQKVDEMPDSFFEFRHLSTQMRLVNWFTRRQKDPFLPNEVKMAKINSPLKKELELDPQREYSDDELQSAILRKQLLTALRRDEIYRQKHKFYLFQTLMELALLFLSPILAIVVWFLLAQAGIQGDNSGETGQTGIFILAVVSFTVGLVTHEVVQTLIKFTTGILQGITTGQEIPTEEATKPLLIDIVDKPTNISIGTESKFKVKISDKESGDVVSSAKVSAIVRDPSNNEYLELPKKLSDSTGTVEYSWIVSENSTVGTYHLSVSADAQGYERGLIEFDIEIIKSTPAEPTQ